MKNIALLFTEAKRMAIAHQIAEAAACLDCSEKNVVEIYATFEGEELLDRIRRQM
jgi:hypothetical protein